MCFCGAAAARASSSSSSSRGVVRLSSQTTISCTDFVGSHSAGFGQRIAGGELLGLMDITAARTAMYHVTGMKTKWQKKKSEDASDDDASGISVATVGTDNTAFYGPLLHGDVATVTGTVIHAGSSSVGVHIQAHRVPHNTVRQPLVAEAFFSMVAIDRNLRAAKVVPGVQLDTPLSMEKHAEYNEIRAAQRDNVEYFKRLEMGSPLRPEDIDDDINAKKASHVSIISTETNANRLFFSGHLNLNNTIFGGEILRWMEAHATFCGKRFTRNRHVYSIGMHSVSFNNPIYITDWVSLRTRVALVRNSTLEVDVKLTVEREGSPVMTNRASFVLINMDETGVKSEISTGLSLDDADQRVMRHIAMAKYRYEKSEAFHARKKLNKLK